jgi:hypothetical protein
MEPGRTSARKKTSPSWRCCYLGLEKGEERGALREWVEQVGRERGVGLKVALEDSGSDFLRWVWAVK